MTDPVAPVPADREHPTPDPELDPELASELEADLASSDPITALRTTKGESVAAAVGSFMAGIEQQVFQRRPPAVELVQEHAPIRATSEGGLEVTIDVPPLPRER